MIIDAHTHITKLENTPFAKKSYEEIRSALLAEMKKNKVDHALVIANWRGEDGTGPSTDTLIKLTEELSNLHVIGSLNVSEYTKQDLDRLEVLIRLKKIVGVKLYLGYQHFYPGDSVARPIYEMCDRLGVPVIFHTGDTLAYKTFAKVKYAHPLGVDEVAVDFPNLKIVIAHLGNPWMMDCAEVLYRNPNVYADISGLFLHDGFNSPYGKMTIQKIKELIAYSQTPRKLIFGTDWPLAGPKEYIKYVKKLGISKTDMEYVMYKNAAKLFKINV
ncbi:MAG: amidohydrolase 2 [Parcubacteria group bacterium Gr01-1014_3]|nr:MAG: amidohydrolase 2 [Parcubacteria group bacterium Gr01-1014_3]